MIRKLSLDEILELVHQKPEQAIFDWKSDFTIPSDSDKQGEIIKDVTAIANALTLSPGFIIYGVDPQLIDPVLGVSKSYDDASLQQLFEGKVVPRIEFAYYEVLSGPKTIAVIQVFPTRRRPHIIALNIGKVKDGQIPIRRGSATDGAKIEDLFEMFYGESSGYFPSVIQKLQLNIQQRQIALEEQKMLSKLTEDLERKIQRSIWGFPF
jgi:predicted HTH transcriptional regulator